MKKAFFLKFTALALLLAVVASGLPLVSADDSAYDGSMAGDGMGILAHGVDLSSWQGTDVDFERIRAQGIDFVILRAGFSNTQDAVFERNYAAAKAAGLDIGVYVYSYAATPEAARSEAESCKRWLADKQLEYPVYFDLEDPEVHGAMSKEALTALALAFLDTVAADGWLVGLYSCRSWLEEKIDTQRIGQTYECWIAQYPSSGEADRYEQYHATYGAWQYSASGCVDGVPGNADLDVAFKDYPAICRQYGFNGYTAQGETISLQKAAVPAVVNQGEAFDASGIVRTREGVLRSVTLGIYDSAERMVSGATAEPNAEEFDLALIRHSVDLTGLPDGEYTYRISAATDDTERLLHASRFAVSRSGLWLSEAELPVDLKEGTDFALTGRLLSAAQLRSLRAELVDADGTAVQRAETAASGMEFALSALELDFASLKKGEYRCRFTAQTADGERTTETEPFYVWVKRDPIRLTGCQLNEAYAPAELTGLTGTVSSQRSALRLEATVSDADGAVLATAETGGEERTAELSTLDAQLRLDELPLGYYMLQITATNDAGPAILRRDSFSIVRDEISLCAPELPATLGQGDSFLFGGAIASDRSPLTFVSAALLDERGVPVRSFAAQPNRTVFDLRELNAGLSFSDLPAGSYRLRITAENGQLRKQLRDAPVLITEQPVRIRWDGPHMALQGLCFSEGMVMGCYGTLTADAPITLLRASVCDAEERELTAASLQTQEETVNVAQLNEQLRLAALPEGQYCLRLYAACGGSEALLLCEEFSVAACRHAAVRTGTSYPAACDRVGAVSPARCMRCGGAIAAGTVQERLPHIMHNGACADCGRAEWKFFRVTEQFSGFSPDGRYVLAIRTEEGWYALDADAKAVALREMPTEVTSDLLWSAELLADKSIVLRNYRGEALHLDEGQICAAKGWGHAALRPLLLRGQVLLTGEAGALCFSDGEFSAGPEAAKLTVLTLQWDS